MEHKNISHIEHQFLISSKYLRLLESNNCPGIICVYMFCLNPVLFFNFSVQYIHKQLWIKLIRIRCSWSHVMWIKLIRVRCSWCHVMWIKLISVRCSWNRVMWIKLIRVRSSWFHVNIINIRNFFPNPHAMQTCYLIRYIKCSN